MKQSEKKRRGDWLVKLLIALCAALFLFSIWKILSARREYEAGTQVYAALVETVVAEPVQPSEPPSEAPLRPDAPAAEEEEALRVSLLAVDFAALQTINPRTVAWIRGQDGRIDYPVVQGEDNTYYLTHLIDGTENRNGSIFMDYRNKPDFSARNTFLYGHNMENDTMFAGLEQYADPAYYAGHPTMILVTPSADYVLEIFSGYVASPSSDTYKTIYRSDALFLDYVEYVRARSLFQTDVEITASDRLVTLSTCDSGAADGRFVLHCKLTPAEQAD